MMDIDLLKKYCSATGVSGFESDVTKMFLDEMAKAGAVCDTDVMGNAYACTDHSGQWPVMIETHCDEIGFQVINISDSGLIYLRRNGGIDEQCLPGSEVTIRTLSGEDIAGVIGKKPIHLMSQDDRRRTAEIHQLWVDTGLPADEVKEKVAVGDTVAHAPNFRVMGRRVASKALDNRAGLFVISEVMKNLTSAPFDAGVCAVATTQEEVGSRGAVVAAYRCRPKVAVTVDLDFATDLPDMSPNRYGDVGLGRGVILPVNADVSPRLLETMTGICREHDIPFQCSARPHATGGTNTSRIQLSREGIDTITLGIPCRYMHTPVEMCDLADLASAIRLLTLFCRTLPS